MPVVLMNVQGYYFQHTGIGTLLRDDIRCRELVDRRRHDLEVTWAVVVHLHLVVRRVLRAVRARRDRASFLRVNLHNGVVDEEAQLDRVAIAYVKRVAI